MEDNHQLIWKAGDGESGITDKALMDAKFVGTTGGDNADASRLNLKLIIGAVLSGYCEGIGGFNGI